jgi:hypothetical protein
MTIRISETIHKWMGWCPAKSAMAQQDRLQGYGTKPGHAPESPETDPEKRIIDYGLTGTPLHLLIFCSGIAVIVPSIILVNLVFPFIDTIMFLGILTCSGFILIYNKKMQKTLEFRGDSIIIQRAIFKPVVIPKDEIATAEIRDNRQPLPHWFMAVIALIIMPVMMIAGISDRLAGMISGGITTWSFVIYAGYIIVFTLTILSIYHYSCIRYRYPKVFVIETIKNQILVIYGKNSEDLAEIKEKFL